MRTEKCRTPGLHDAANPALVAAIAAGATQTGAAVDREFVLEIPEFPVGLAVIAQRRSAGRNRPLQHVFNGRGQTLKARSAEGTGATARRNSGLKQRFAGVNIAEPGDVGLIEKRRLDRGLAACECGRQGGGVESAAERLHSEVLEQGMALQDMVRKDSLNMHAMSMPASSIALMSPSAVQSDGFSRLSFVMGLVFHHFPVGDSWGLEK